MQSAGGQAASVNTGSAAPFNVTGVQNAQNPQVAATAQPNATLAVGNVKRVWGQASAEDVKAPDVPATTAAAASTANPTSLGGPSAPAKPTGPISTARQAK